MTKKQAGTSPAAPPLKIRGGRGVMVITPFIPLTLRGIKGGEEMTKKSEKWGKP